LGIDGLSYSNTGDSLNDYYCFGKDVVAVADGVVVKVQKGLPDDPSLLKGAGESQDEYDQRISMSQFKILKSNFYHSAGNYIVIRHSGDEFSFYAHLKKGSITVKQGDQIKQEQNIGQVGHSGNSTEPHLHFQISDGPDPLRSRSVPVRFSNINLFERKGNGYLRFGDIVRTFNQH
jgi:murein DD-endopeptidase MepM/ murein hydrolase activator NlpD